MKLKELIKFNYDPQIIVLYGLGILRTKTVDTSELTEEELDADIIWLRGRYDSSLGRPLLAVRINCKELLND